MGGSYRQCSECGKRALSIATRCPGCGRALPAPEGPDDRPALDLGRLLSPGGVVGVVAAAAVLMGAVLGREPFRVPVDPDGAGSEVAYAVAAAVPGSASATPAPAESAGQLLVARTWTHVRSGRSKSADLEAVLLPGDSVLADSLARGWYRVALEGEVLGYVHRSTLAAPGEGRDIR